MPRGDQLARQWKIIQTLITSRRGKSAAELAEDLECHPRTLYRDLEALQKKSIEMVYYSMSRKKEGKRKVDPYRIWFFNGTFYLIGYCHLRNEVRVFALDRIKMLHQTKESFEVAEDFDFEEFMGPSFGVYQGKPVKVRIWFSPEAAGYIKEKIWHETQKTISQKDGSIVFEAEVAGTEEIKFWVMSWGSKTMVIEPSFLRQEIRAEAEAMAEKYGKAVEPEEESAIA